MFSLDKILPKEALKTIKRTPLKKCKRCLLDKPEVITDCSHRICVDCLDELYDSFDSENEPDLKDTLFICEECGKRVVDIVYPRD